MVAVVVGDEHTVQSAALSQSAAYGKHDAVTERYHRRLHILLVIIAFGNSVSTFEQRRLEVAVHKVERNDNMLNP